MRFLSVDPFAADYAAWSGYHYVLGNPLVFVDPNGRSSDNIVIPDLSDKAASYSDYKRGEAAYGKLKSLTDDVLTVDNNGNVTIAQKVDGGKNSEGTALIRSLIEGGKNGKGDFVNYNVTIEYGTTNETASNKETNSNGVGDSSTVYFNHEGTGNQSLMKMEVMATCKNRTK
jgi:hypothetical protein